MWADVPAYGLIIKYAYLKKLSEQIFDELVSSCAIEPDFVADADTWELTIEHVASRFKREFPGEYRNWERALARYEQH